MKKFTVALSAFIVAAALTACSQATPITPTVTPDYTPTPVAVAVVTVTPTSVPQTAVPPTSIPPTPVPPTAVPPTAVPTPVPTQCPCPVTWTTTPVTDDKGEVLYYTAPDLVQEQVKVQLLEAYIAFGYPHGFSEAIARQNAEIFTVQGSVAYRGKLKRLGENLEKGEYERATAPKNPSFDPIQFSEDGLKATVVMAFPEGDMTWETLSIATGAVLESGQTSAKARAWYMIYNPEIGRWQIDYNEKLEVKDGN